jgi:hypothetical protein
VPFLLTELSVAGLETQIGKLATQLHALAIEKQKFAEALRKGNPSLSSLPEKVLQDMAGVGEDRRLVVDVPFSDLNGFTCAGVDGGVQSASLLGIDILLVRAVAAVISYAHRGIYSTRYFPARNPQPKVLVSMERFSPREFDATTGLKRTLEELKTALALISEEERHVDLLLMDGSLTTSTYLVYSEHSGLKPLADEVLATMESLVEASQQKGVLLAFVVKDSRSAHFVEFIGKLLPLIADEVPDILKIGYRRILRASRDQDFMARLLRTGTRSFCLRRGQLDFSESDSPEVSVYSFYIKPAPYDFPLRVEFAQEQKSSDEAAAREADSMASKISSILLPLSQFHSAYALPAPIIEADARARLPNHVMDAILQMLRNRAPLLETTRKKRERNPFAL